MKSIETLVEDIYDLFDGKHVLFDEVNVADLSSILSSRINNRMAEIRGAPTLRLSNLGKEDRHLWYSINQPDKAEPLRPATRVKFLFGDILEALLIYLARQAGHTVTGEQDELDLYGVKGHRDCLIDGVLVDVKSASSFSFNKFNAGLTKGDDAFGYLTQLDSYLHASTDCDNSRGAFLVVDKQHGKIVLDFHDKSKVDYEKVVNLKRAMLAQPTPPDRDYQDKPYGASGNMALDVVCSYCDFKNHCWPGLRTFAYANGPVFLTKVKRQPHADVEEIT